MELGIRDRIALVLGAGGGLGSAIAYALAREGARLALADVDEAALRVVEANVSAMGVQAQRLTLDLADLPAIDANVSAIEGKLGPVDILINITGGPPPTPAAGQKPELWQNQFQAMVAPVIAITDRVLPGMRARQWGRVITSTSSGVIMPIPNLGVSNALRSALVGWSKTLSREVAHDGVTCNVVVPGRIATARIRALDQARGAREGRPVREIAAESAASIPIGRYGEPEEYAAAVTFLASAPASYITGAIIRVDGGLIPSV
jgi:3-oxoacyl-[acyl-carrier protein] reductase